MSMRQAALAAEHLALRVAHRAWVADHARLLGAVRYDHLAHSVHGEQLHRHSQRLRAYSEAFQNARFAL